MPNCQIAHVFNMTDTFQPIYIKTDVTALKIINENILAAGIGSIFHVFTLQGELKYTKQIFTGQKIHGIISSGDDLLIFGGKSIQLATLTPTDVNLGKTIHLNDWIITLIQIGDGPRIAALTAHNLVQIWDISTGSLERIHGCEEKCIIYSGLLQETADNLTVLSGTVFSQVVIWNIGDESIRHRLIGHKGVIFSISYDIAKNLIVTTSDDRTVRLWSIESVVNAPKITLMGHTARVMRNRIIGDYIVSIGEDSALCIWDVDGNLINKRRIHQDGCIWSLDARNDVIVTGGGDGGIIIHNLQNETHNVDVRILNFPNDEFVAKKIAFTFRNNIICLTEQGDIMYYDFVIDKWIMKLDSDLKYMNLSISKCRQFVAAYDINGCVDIFAETCKNEPNIVHCVSRRVCQTKLLSFHWLHGRKFIVCEKDGLIGVWDMRGDQCVKVDEYRLPQCKERWLTSALITGKRTIVGDRCGNVHVFETGVDPVLTVPRIHGRLGINSISTIDDRIITTGRDSSVKYFSDDLRLSHSIKLPFAWIEHFITDSMVCGFRETHFIVWNVEQNQSVFEFNCGGGHRSWDIVRKVSNGIESLQFSFIKKTSVHTFNVNLQNTSRTIMEGFHTKEINRIVITKHGDCFTMISGGEDTALRVHEYRTNSDNQFKEIFRISKHLSNIRDICLCRTSGNRCIAFTAGGRAQICAWDLSDGQCREIVNYMLKSDRERKGNKSWKSVEVDVEAETRFMCLDCIDQTESITLLAGSSDGFLRIYSLENNQLTLQNSFNFNSKCILKVTHVVVQSSVIIMTMYTDGTIAFWNFTCLDRPFHQQKFHKSGINSFDFKLIGNKLLLATGGDDNDVQLNLISFSADFTSLTVIDVWHNDTLHCSQITGVKFVNEQIFTASIDQRLTALKWKCEGDTISCEFISQYHTSVSDIQGMEIFQDGFYACIYGKGVEIISIKYD